MGSNRWVVMVVVVVVGRHACTHARRQDAGSCGMGPFPLLAFVEKQLVRGIGLPLQCSADP